MLVERRYLNHWNNLLRSAEESPSQRLHVRTGHRVHCAVGVWYEDLEGESPLPAL